MALDKGIIPIPGFIRPLPTLAVYDVAHSLPLAGVDRDFPFTEDETRKHFSYFSGIFRENKTNKNKISRPYNFRSLCISAYIKKQSLFG